MCLVAYALPAPAPQSHHAVSAGHAKRYTAAVRLHPQQVQQALQTRGLCDGRVGDN